MTETSATQKALSTLRSLIFTGELPPGSDHLEGEIAERLGMSRTPVREAAVVLESQGLIALRPRRGFRVNPISATDMGEIYDILTELECLAAQRAAEAGHEDRALAPLAESIDAMEAALDQDDLEGWAKADDRFHEQLVRLGGNARLRAITAMMSDQVRRARTVTLFMRPKPVKSNEDHRKVFAAIRAGDGATARTVHRTHRQGAKELLLSLLEQHRLSQL